MGSDTKTPAIDSNLEHQIAFARHNFDNHQALIRACDTKSAVLITIMVFLGASVLQISKDAAAKIRWHPRGMALLSGFFVAAAVALFVAIIRAFITVHRVVKSRGARYYMAPLPGRDLLWQEHVLLHGNNTEYFEAVQSASQATILRNLTDQVFELAHISKEKMDSLRGAHWAIWLAFWSWAAAVALGLILLKT